MQYIKLPIHQSLNAVCTFRFSHCILFTRCVMMSNICEGTSYKSTKKQAEDRCLWRIWKWRSHWPAETAAHQKKCKHRIKF